MAVLKTESGECFVLGEKFLMDVARMVASDKEIVEYRRDYHTFIDMCCFLEKEHIFKEESHKWRIALNGSDCKVDDEVIKVLMGKGYTLATKANSTTLNR